LRKRFGWEGEKKKTIARGEGFRAPGLPVGGRQGLSKYHRKKGRGKDLKGNTKGGGKPGRFYQNEKGRECSSRGALIEDWRVFNRGAKDWEIETIRPKRK